MKHPFMVARHIAFGAIVALIAYSGVFGVFNLVKQSPLTESGWEWLNTVASTVGINTFVVLVATFQYSYWTRKK